jgi:hypothetical protein
MLKLCSLRTLRKAFVAFAVTGFFEKPQFQHPNFSEIKKVIASNNILTNFKIYDRCLFIIIIKFG